MSSQLPSKQQCICGERGTLPGHLLGCPMYQEPRTSKDEVIRWLHRINRQGGLGFDAHAALDNALLYLRSTPEPPDVPSVEPIARVINNNQPGWTNIVETAPNVTLDVGAPLYSRESMMRLAAALAGAIHRTSEPPSATCFCGAHEWRDGYAQIKDSHGRLHMPCACQMPSETKSEQCSECHRPLPPEPEWSTPVCPDCTERLEFAPPADPGPSECLGCSSPTQCAREGCIIKRTAGETLGEQS